jgi:hypothetical protein
MPIRCATDESTDFVQSLIQIARRQYVGEDFGVELDNTVYALDASTIDSCLSVFPWAPFRQSNGAIKLHTLLDPRVNIPSFIHISDGKLDDVDVVDILIPKPGAFYVMGRGYLPFARLFQLHQARAFFAIRAKSNTKTRRLYSRPIDKGAGTALRSDRSAQRRPHHALLSRDAEAGEVLRCRHGQDFRLPHQPLRAGRLEHCRTLSLLLADGALNGSSSTSGSKRSTILPRMPSAPKSGSRSLSAYGGH